MVMINSYMMYIQQLEGWLFIILLYDVYLNVICLAEYIEHLG